MGYLELLEAETDNALSKTYSVQSWPLVKNCKKKRLENAECPEGFLKRLFQLAFWPTPAWKPVSRVDVGMETGFHASIGQNADFKNLEKPISEDTLYLRNSLAY